MCWKKKNKKTAETQLNTSIIRRMVLGARESKFLCTTVNEAIKYRIRNELEPIIEWIYYKKEEWNAHVNRMVEDRIVKITHQLHT